MRGAMITTSNPQDFIPKDSWSICAGHGAFITYPAVFIAPGYVLESELWFSKEIFPKKKPRICRASFRQLRGRFPDHLVTQ
ncbi:Uncharacterised protein [Serratia grimesii]|nr:Uncharacterised protein [Serratia grimesii]